jgi:polar amino acid transport system substrate-binding protein
MIGTLVFACLVGLAVLGAAAWSGTAATTDTSAGNATTDVVTSPTLARIRSSDTLRACIDPEFPPEVYMKGGQPAGFDIALTKEVAKALGVKIEWVRSSFDGLIAGLQSNKCDIALSGVTPRGTRALSVSFAKPTLAGKEAVIVKRTETRTTIRALNSPSVRFCGQAGTGSEFDAKKYFPKAKLTKVPSAEQCLLQVLSNRADATITDTVTGNGWLKAHRKDLKLILQNANLPAAPVGAAVQLGDLGFVAYLNVFFGEWINNGNYQPTFRREMGYSPDMAELYRQRGNF